MPTDLPADWFQHPYVHAEMKKQQFSFSFSSITAERFFFLTWAKKKTALCVSALWDVTLSGFILQNLMDFIFYVAPRKAKRAVLKHFLLLKCSKGYSWAPALREMTGYCGRYSIKKKKCHETASKIRQTGSKSATKNWCISLFPLKYMWNKKYICKTSLHL